MLRSSHHYEIVDETRRPAPESSERFDRIAFALRALDAMRPRRLTVAVYSRSGDFRVERVRDLRRGAGASWAAFGIPRTASRAQIALALAELAGLDRVPFAVGALVEAGSATPEARA